jgi:hypothetical protein
MRRRRVNTNGDFTIWQLATAFSPALHGHLFADMWRYANTTEAVHNLELSTDVPHVGEAKSWIGQSAKITCTKAAPSIGTHQNIGLVYRGEGYEWTECWQRPTTISFWVKASEPGTYFTGLANGAQDLSCPMPYTIASANTWEFHAVTLPPSPAGTWYFDRRVGYSLYFFLALGSNFWGKAETWNPGRPGGDERQVNMSRRTGATFQLANVQLEVGDAATPFETSIFGDELRACQRYIEKSWPMGEQLMSGGVPISESHLCQAHAATAAEVAPQTRAVSGKRWTWLSFPKAFGARSSPDIATASEAVRFTVPKRKKPTVYAFAPSNDLSAEAMISGGLQTACDNATEIGVRLRVTAPRGGAIPDGPSLHWLADASLPLPGDGA